MAISYTNRKGITYHLCRTASRTGQTRYVFAREPRGEPVDELPAGHRISESVNGVVSLVREVPPLIRPGELAVVEAAVQRHPRSGQYRVAAQRDRIVVFERSGPDADDLLAVLVRTGIGVAHTKQTVQEHLDRAQRYAPVVRFTLANAMQRTFVVERRSYLGRGDSWLHLAATGPIDELAGRAIPTLSTDAFFELD